MTCTTFTTSRPAAEAFTEHCRIPSLVDEFNRACNFTGPQVTVEIPAHLLNDAALEARRILALYHYDGPVNRGLLPLSRLAKA